MWADGSNPTFTEWASGSPGSANSCVVLRMDGTWQDIACTTKKSYICSFGPTLPKLPDAFEATVEANIINKDYSFIMDEFYDKKNDRARLVMHGSRSSSISVRIPFFHKQCEFSSNCVCCYF